MLISIFITDLIRYTQPLYVSNENPDARRLISEAIRQRVQSEKDFEQLMLFPEGGCGNRKALLQFKLGNREFIYLLLLFKKSLSTILHKSVKNNVTIEFSIVSKPVYDAVSQ